MVALEKDVLVVFVPPQGRGPARGGDHRPAHLEAGDGVFEGTAGVLTPATQQPATTGPSLQDNQDHPPDGQLNPSHSPHPFPDSLFSLPHKCPALNVRDRVQEWMSIGTDSLTLEVIKSGVKLMLAGVPPPHHPQNFGKVSEEEWKLLQDLLEKGVIRQLTQLEFAKTRVWTPIFATPKKEQGTFRLITDLRHINLHLNTPKFRQDTWATVMEALELNDPKWAVKVDLKDYFHHLAIHPHSQRWIRLKAGEMGFQFLCLPFGLQSSPYWCHLLAKAVLAHLRPQQYLVVWYVDDILVLGQDPSELSEKLLNLLTLFNRLGLRVNVPKSVLVPCQRIEFLGLDIDLVARSVSIPAEQLVGLNKMLKHLASGRKASPAQVAALAGKMIYFGNACLPLAAFSRPVMRFAGRMAARGGWRNYQTKPPQLLSMLKTVKETITQSPPLHYTPIQEATWTLTTDASEWGWGASLSTGGRFWQTQGKFLAGELTKPISHLETLAVRFALKAFDQFLPRRGPLTIRLRSDSSTAISCWTRSSPVPELAETVVDMLTELNSREIRLIAEYIPSELNPVDGLSRIWQDKNDYRLKKKIFNYFVMKWNYSPQVDAFASRHNRRCARFWSWHPDPEAEALNAMAQDWNVPGLYMNPPWPLMSAVVRKILRDKARVMIVFPLWKGALWFQALMKVVKRMEVINTSPFVNHEGMNMPPPRWKTAIALVEA